jgi:amino acid adenylation domain-containing protein
MAQSVAAGSESERERLLDALQDRLAAAARSEGIPGRAPGSAAPASFAQRRLWFLDRIEPGNAGYHVPVILRLRGRLDVDALDRAVRAVVARHEVLRTTFGEVDGEPVQLVAEPGDGPLVTVDPAGADDLAPWLTGVLYDPFDLANGPLLRCGLRRVAAEEHVFVVTAHHTVTDGWSLEIFFRELDECYAAFTAGRTPRLAPLAIQYADFAAWQRGRGAEILAGKLAYWRQALSGAPAVLELPRDGERAPSGRFAGAAVSRMVPPGLAARLRRLSAAEGTTTFMTVLAAVQLLLGRLAGTPDVVVGAPIAERPRPELEPLIGLFLNTLALRTDLSGGPTFRALLGRVRRTCLEAYEHQDVPFELLVEAVQPERSTTHAPIFQVMVNHTTTGPLVQRLGDLAAEVVELTDPPAKLPLTLYVDDGGEEHGELRFGAVFQSALFTRQRMEHLLDQLEHLLEQVSSDPDRPVSTYSLAPPATWTVLPDPAVELVREPQPTVRSMIGKWVRDTPDAEALRWGSVSLRYAELWRSAGAIRQRLAARGCSAGTVVAVTGPRTPGLVAALVGVIAGGCVLVTLDPRLPRMRQQTMLAESGATHLVLVGDDPGSAVAAVNTDDLEVIRVAAGAVADPEAPVGPGAADVAGAADVVGAADAAYVFFTSGTTGVPKGVLGRHAGLAHFLSWQRDTFGVGPGDRCAHLTGLSFDVVLRDVLLPLVSGATLVVPERGDELTPSQCLPWLAEQGVTCLHAVPTLAEAWLAERPAGAAPAAVRLTFFAGEPLRGELVRAWRSASAGGGAGAATVVNLYGPTETTLATCAYVVPQGCHAGVQPVGAAMPGAQALVLRPDGGGCGIGEVGEIVIRTPYRSLGYLNVPDSPAWLVNPATADPDDLLYRTGDLGRYRLDGTVDILGRRDRQVKIRGVRVETDEVAAVLCGYPGVEQAAVTTGPDGSGRPMLVAYAVAPAHTAATPAQLQSYLGKRLPAAMVPAAFAFVDAIPRTLNGKVDWTALPPVAPPAPAGSQYLAPRTAAERSVARIVAVLLGRDRVSVLDDFFALGGHSLLAMQLVSRIADASGVTLPLQAVFESRTVAGIASAVVAASPAPVGSAGPAEPESSC